MSRGSKRRGPARVGATGVASIVCVALIAALSSSGIVSASSGATGPVDASASALDSAGGTAVYRKTQTVYAMADDSGAIGDLLVANAFDVTTPGTIVDVTGVDGAVQRLDATQPGVLTSQTTLPQGSKALPWTVTVSYSLNGPDADAKAVTGADGMVGIRIRVEPNELNDTRYGRDGVPLVTFTVPHDVTSNVAVPDGAVVADDGDDWRVAMLGEAGAPNEWNCYLTAKAFRMGRLIMAAVPVTDGEDGDTVAALRDRLNALATDATGLASEQTDSTADDGAYKDIIDELQTLRDGERAKASAEIAAKHDAYVARFGVYIDRYVRSYAAHMSGSPGTKTQMGALIGMTGELTGDTPLSQSVSDLAAAVNEMSAAHEHEGAADILDEVIRQIRRRGTSGLAAELTVRQGREAAAGKTQYSNGQGQLANAMIPFSMAYTDTFTAHRNDGLGVDAAIAQTNADFAGDEAMQRYTTQISAALKAMANASKRTGAAAMLGTVVDRYGARFDAAVQSNGVQGNVQQTDGSGGSSAAAGASGPVLWDDATSRVPFAVSASHTGAGIRPSDPTLVLSAGQGDLGDGTEDIAECGGMLATAVSMLLPDKGGPTQEVRRIIDDGVARVRGGDGGGVGAATANGTATANGAASGDVVSHANVHTVEARFMIVLPAVGDPDSIAASGGGEVGTQIPGLSAIVGKFMS